jgi:hypothetical protein
MANSQGGQGQSRGQGGHGQTFTARQHDVSLGRESQGPGAQHGSESKGRAVIAGANLNPDDLEEAGAAMEPQVDQATGQGIVGGS